MHSTTNNKLALPKPNTEKFNIMDPEYGMSFLLI